MANTPQVFSEAGYYKLVSFEIRPLLVSQREPEAVNEFIDFSKVIVNWNLTEGMTSPFIQGSAVINESDNLLERLPMIGEEECRITYTDFYGDTRTITLFIFAIEDVKAASGINDRMMTYTISFCSQQKLFSDQQEVRRSFANTKISTMVKEIYNSYFVTGNKDVDKILEIEETDGEQTLVIPCLRPDAAMQFLSRRAYSSHSKSSLYTFFETRDRYYFCTPEYLVQNKGDLEGLSEEERNRLFFMYNTVDDNTGEGQIVAQQSIAGINYGTKVDTFADMKAGAYRKTVTELDIAHRTRITRTYDYTDEDEFGEAVVPVDTEQEIGHKKLKLTHSKEFIDTFMAPENAPETVLVTDFPQIGQNEGKDGQRKPYQYFYENYSVKPIVNYHMNTNAFTIEINGRDKLFPGDSIVLTLRKIGLTLSGNSEFDHERSGMYIVLSVTNVFNEDTFKQKLTVTKGGLVA